MKRILHFVSLLFISINLFAQAPQKMTYQAVIRNSSNNLVVSSPVKMKISILQGSTTGTVVYSEEHNPTTNANGLVSIEIGGGTNKTGTFSTIDWGNGTYFLKTETDPTNGNNLSIVGTSQLLSVPYSLYSGNGVKGVSKSGDTLFLDNGKKYLIPGIKDLNAPSTINNGLVGYWPFNGNANDESGNGNDGTVNGATLITDRFGNSNKAYTFDGVNDFIDCGIFSIVGKSSRSINFWYKENAPAPVAGYAAVSWGPPTQGDRFDVGFNYKKPGCSVGAANSAITYNFISSQNNWNNYTIVLPNLSNPTVKDILVFQNGVLLQQTSENYNILTGINTASGYPLFFGKNSTLSAPGFINGDLDDIRIYNRALTQEEITWLANN